MNIRGFITKSAFAVAVVATGLVVFSTGDAEARRGAGGPGFHRPGGTPPLAAANTTVRPASVVSGCSVGRRCATTGANGGVVVTPRGTQGGPGRR
ncbi:MAG: hypothetical protein K2Y71_19070 [Xanthobacteraceae bacterium]|nr:hypothetical protein [Xanthobacteraceae bacterium]